MPKPKLHLGCGSIYLPGYVNIDLPPNLQTSLHPLPTGLHPDRYADITTLQYEPFSVEEVRLHHVFEHFVRPVALRLLVNWYEWLCEGGILTIETPDFDRCIKAYLFGNVKARGKILRHLYGSHDADWAVHCDGWYKSKYKVYLTAMGFRNLQFEYSRWHGTYNITVHAQKIPPFSSLQDRKNTAESLLRMNMVDDSESEQIALRVWIKSFNAL
jgi:hypothetical protein